VNFWKRHVGDIAKACGHLSQGQMGAYDLLLDWLYGNEKPLPKAHESLHRIGRAVSKAERDNVDAVIAEFFTLTADGYVQKRASAEIAKAQAIGETNRRIAAEREARKREAKSARPEHEPLNASSHASCSKREPSHQPLATSQISQDERSGHTPPAAAVADRTGQFEGHDEPRDTPNPVAPFAIALTRAGFQCTSLHPDLVAYQRDGGTVAHLTECAQLPDCTGKPAAYAIRIARRELAERAQPITGASHEPSRPRRLSAVEQVQHAIAERRDREAAASRTFDA
jgi:uncharacterized protein YdaU (DUF1376 family)